MQRLIHVCLGNGDVVFNSPRNRFPLFVNFAEDVVTFVHRTDNNAYRRQIVNLVECLVLKFHLFIDGIEVLGTPEYFPFDIPFAQNALDFVDDEIDEVVSRLQLLVNVFYEKLKRLGIEIF